MDTRSIEESDEHWSLHVDGSRRDSSQWMRPVLVIHSGRHEGTEDSASHVSRAAEAADRGFDELSMTSDSGPDNEERDWEGLAGLGQIEEALGMKSAWEEVADFTNLFSLRSVDSSRTTVAALRSEVEDFQRDIREEQGRLRADVAYPMDIYSLREAMVFLENAASELVDQLNDAHSGQEVEEVRANLEDRIRDLKVCSRQRRMLADDAAGASEDPARVASLKVIHEIGEWRKSVQGHPEEDEHVERCTEIERDALNTYCRSLEDGEFDLSEWESITSVFREEQAIILGDRLLRQESASWTYLTDSQKDTLRDKLLTVSGAERIALINKVHKWMNDIPSIMNTIHLDWGTQQPEVGQQVFFRESSAMLLLASDEAASAHITRVLTETHAGMLKAREEIPMEQAQRRRRQEIEGLKPERTVALAHSDFCVWLVEYATDHNIYRQLQGPGLATAHEDEYYPWLAQVAPLVEKRLNCVSRAATITRLVEGVLLRRLVPNRNEAFVFTARGAISDDGRSITLPTFRLQEVSAIDPTAVQSAQGFYASPALMHDLEGAAAPLMTYAQANTLVREIARLPDIPWEHTPDGCAARAEATCQMLIAMGYDRANIKRHYVSSPNLKVLYKGEAHDWSFHVAITIKVQGDVWMILDPACNKEKALTKNEWIASFEPEYTPSPPGSPDTTFESIQHIRHDFSRFLEFTVPSAFHVTYHSAIERVSIKAYEADERIEYISELSGLRRAATLNNILEKTPILREQAQRFSTFGTAMQMETIDDLEAWVSTNPTTLAEMSNCIEELEQIEVAALCKAYSVTKPQLARDLYKVFKVLNNVATASLKKAKKDGTEFDFEEDVIKLSKKNMSDAKAIVNQQRHEHCLRILDWAASDTPTFATLPASLRDMRDLDVVHVVRKRLSVEQSAKMMDALVAAKRVVNEKIARKSTSKLKKLLKAIDNQIKHLAEAR